MHLYPLRRNVAAQVAEELITVTYATLPMEERRTKCLNWLIDFFQPVFDPDQYIGTLEELSPPKELLVFTCTDADGDIPIVSLKAVNPSTSCIGCFRILPCQTSGFSVTLVGVFFGGGGCLQSRKSHTHTHEWNYTSISVQPTSPQMPQREHKKVPNSILIIPIPRQMKTQTV